MYKRLFTMLTILLILLTGTTAARADEPDTGFLWAAHTEPFNYKFGNLIDNHQQTRLLKNGRLHGFIYVQFTGETIDGIPVARRANCDDPALDCRVGWEVIGIPVGGAKLVQKGPRIWKIDQEALPSDPEFTHFHWVGTPKKPCGLKLMEEDPAISYSGYLLKRTAVATFYWLGGNDDKEVGRLVTPGVDLHSNLEGRWTGGGGHDGEHDTGEEPGGDTGCGGHEPGGEPGGPPGGDTGGDTGGCGDHETGEEPGGDTGCGGHDPGGELGG